MANVGPKFWQWVTTDTAGVPHGGQFGDVPRFEPVLNQHGLIVGWSRARKCFGIATHGPSGWACQMLLMGRTKPIPFSQKLVSALLTARAERQSNKTLIEIMAQRERDQRQQQMKERYTYYADRKGDVIDRVKFRTGRKIVIPIHGLRGGV